MNNNIPGFSDLSELKAQRSPVSIKEVLPKVIPKSLQSNQLFCAYCDAIVDFAPTRKTTTCKSCGHLIYRNVTEKKDERFHCKFCDDSFVIPYLKQIGNELYIYSVICDCEKAQKFLRQEREKDKYYPCQSYSEKFHHENKKEFKKRWEDIQTILDRHNKRKEQ